MQVKKVSWTGEKLVHIYIKQYLQTAVWDMYSYTSFEATGWAAWRERDVRSGEGRREREREREGGRPTHSSLTTSVFAARTLHCTCLI